MVNIIVIITGWEGESVDHVLIDTTHCCYGRIQVNCASYFPSIIICNTIGRLEEGVKPLVVTVINSGQTRDPFLDLCIRHLAMLSACFNIDLRIQHIKGVDNFLADALSRGNYIKLGEVMWEVVAYQLLTVF